MKKVIAAICCMAMFAFISCKKDGGNNDVEVNGKVTWESLVAEYPFLGNFPKFDGEIEMHQHNVTMGLESVVFFDYKCDQSVATTYYEKLLSAGFTKNEYAEIYKKTVSGSEYVFTGSYAAGSFALSFSCQSND